MIFAGVDVGSMTAEAVLIEETEIRASSISMVKPNPVESAAIVMNEVLEKTGLTHADVAGCVSTGYGREKIPFATHNVSEISCHGKGAHWADASVRTIIDVGGQDCKVIRVDEQGHLVDFVMNDKCAAGTGRFLEGIAKTFGVHVSELGPLALRGTDAVAISSICTVFTQFDVLNLLADGATREDVALGVATTLATRVHRLVARVGAADAVCVTGGVAKNPAVVAALQQILAKPFSNLPVDPQIIGALGAAVFAKQRYAQTEGRA